MKVKKCISPRHCFQKSHQTKNMESVSIFPGLLCLCVIVHLLQKAVVLKMEMLFGQKKRKKKMLMFCSLALIVKIKLCGGNLCDSFFFSPHHCTPSFPPALVVIAVMLPEVIVLQDEMCARVWANCGFFVCFFFKKNPSPSIKHCRPLYCCFSQVNFGVDCLVQSVAFLSGHIGPVEEFAAKA